MPARNAPSGAESPTDCATVAAPTIVSNDPTVLSAHWIEIVAVTAALVIIKSAAITILVRVERHEWGVAYRCGLMLGHGGEFGLLLISVAMGHALLPDRAAQIVLAAIVASMFLAPLLIHVSGPSRAPCHPGTGQGIRKSPSASNPSQKRSTST
jgi:Kef-type K+ transport system membrane component KefB